MVSKISQTARERERALRNADLQHDVDHTPYEGRTRPKAYPDVPTMQRQGFPEFETMNWHGISGPAKLPPAPARRINQDINVVLAMANVQEEFEGFGVEDAGGTIERCARTRQMGEDHQGRQGIDRRLSGEDRRPPGVQLARSTP